MATPNCHSLSSTDYLSYKTYEETKTFILERVSAQYPGPFDIGIVCGSGLGGLSKLLSGDIIELDYKVVWPF
jgi:purine-nucleoside phosphorylase